MCTNLVHTGGFQYPVQFGDPDLSLFYLFVSFKIPSILHKLRISYAKQIEILRMDLASAIRGAGGIGIVLRYKQHENIFQKGISKPPIIAWNYEQ